MSETLNPEERRAYIEEQRRRYFVRGTFGREIWNTILARGNAPHNQTGDEILSMIRRFVEVFRDDLPTGLEIKTPFGCTFIVDSSNLINSTAGEEVAHGFELLYQRAHIVGELEDVLVNRGVMSPRVEKPRRPFFKADVF